VEAAQAQLALDTAPESLVIGEAVECVPNLPRVNLGL